MAREQAETGPRPDRRAIRAVLVDDHAIVRQGVRRLLGAAGDIDVVAEAGSYGEALAAVRAVPCDVVVTDVLLPDGSGLELPAALHRERLALPVVVLSVHPSERLGEQPCAPARAPTSTRAPLPKG